MPSISRRSAFGGVAVLAMGCNQAAAQTMAAGQAPLAIKGYDAVAYFSDGRPRQGLPDIEYEWDEQRYRFATAEHRELFKADPTRYAPQFANFCAISLSKGELVVADPESWLINDGKLYLFGRPEGPELFRQNIPGNTRDANDNAMLLPKKR
jgi:hypothetical protein